MDNFRYHIMVTFVYYRVKGLTCGLISWVKCSFERLTVEKNVFVWWMSAELAASDEQPILPTSTNPCITRADGTQGVSIITWQREHINQRQN
jgi:hypothetical protein